MPSRAIPQVARVEVEARGTGVCGALLGRAIAISPGRITRNGRTFGNCSDSGVRRAALMESGCHGTLHHQKSVTNIQTKHKPETHHQPEPFPHPDGWYAGLPCRPGMRITCRQLLG